MTLDSLVYRAWLTGMAFSCFKKEDSLCYFENCEVGEADQPFMFLK